VVFANSDKAVRVNWLVMRAGDLGVSCRPSLFPFSREDDSGGASTCAIGFAKRTARCIAPGDVCAACAWMIQQTVAHLGELNEHGRLEAGVRARNLIATPEEDNGKGLLRHGSPIRRHWPHLEISLRPSLRITCSRGKSVGLCNGGLHDWPPARVFILHEIGKCGRIHALGINAFLLQPGAHLGQI